MEVLCTVLSVGRCFCGWICAHISGGIDEFFVGGGVEDGCMETKF